MADGVGHIDGNDRVSMQSDHHAETSSGNQVDGSDAEARGQDAIEGRGSASALNVSEHADAHFFFGTNGDGVADQVADGTDATVFLQLRRQLHTFSHYHNGEVLAAFLALGDV